MGARLLTQPPFLTRTAMRRMATRLPAEPTGPAWKTYGLAGHVLVHFLGIKWVKAHLHADRGSTSFLRQGNWDRISIDDRDRHFEKVMTFAELLINLQHIPGFACCLSMISGGDIEAGLAELETAKLLSIHGVSFKFVEPVGRRGEDYDFEIKVRDTWVAADTKAKLEGSQPSERTVVDSLKRAADQLPADRPSFVFLRVPPSWLFPDFAPAYRIIEGAVETFFRGSSRVAAVKVHGDVAPLYDDAPVIPRLAITVEYDNPRSRFKEVAGWKLFKGGATHARWKPISKLATGQEPEATPIGPLNPFIIWPP